MVLVSPGSHAQHVEEQFATTQLMERHENVVQGATDRREQREVPSSPIKHQSEEELKRADLQLVEKSGSTARKNKSESTRR